MTASRHAFHLIGSLVFGAVSTSASESANYSMDPAGFGGAGRSSAGPYTQNAAFDPYGGHSVSGSGDVVAKAGYVGQLVDPVSVEVTMVPEDVPELSTAQLAAALVMDDGSKTNVEPDVVVWGIKHGPVSAISTGGLLETEAVYQDTPAEVQAEFAGSSSGSLVFTVLDTVTDNFGAYSGDGLEDAWQVLHFGLDNPAAAPGADPDGDGQNNRFEWTAGIHPLDPLARFVFQIENSLSPGQMDLVFSPLVPGRVYRVLHGPSPDAIVTPLASAPPVDVGNERTLTDPSPADERRFYRVEITRE